MIVAGGLGSKNMSKIKQLAPRALKMNSANAPPGARHSVRKVEERRALGGRRFDSET